jgi:hypothetical protein
LPTSTLNTVIIVTSQLVETPIAHSGSSDTFLEVLAPGLSKLTAAGVSLELLPHPDQDPERYRHLLSRHGLDIRVVAGGSFRAAVARADMIISSVSPLAFQAAALGAPILLWLGPAPRWVREEHLVAPWTESAPGTFEGSKDFQSLVDDLIERPADGLRVAATLGRGLARYALPFNTANFAEALHRLAA